MRVVAVLTAWNRALCIVALEARRIQRDTATFLVMGWLTTFAGGQALLWAVALLVVLLITGLSALLFLLPSIQQLQDGKLLVAMMVVGTTILFELLRPMKRFFQDDQEYLALSCMPNALSAAVLGRLVVRSFPLVGTSLLVLIFGGLVAAMPTVSLGAWVLFELAAVGFVWCVKMFLRTVFAATLGARQPSDPSLATTVLGFALYFAAGLVAYHVAATAWRLGTHGSDYVAKYRQVVMHWWSNFRGLASEPDPAVITLLSVLIALEAVVLPLLARAVSAVERPSIFHVAIPHTRYVAAPVACFEGRLLKVLITVDLLRTLRTARSREALSALATAFFLIGLLAGAGFARAQRSSPWTLLLLETIGLYGIASLAEDAAKEIAGLRHHREELTVLRLAPVHLHTVLWSKTIGAGTVLFLPSILFAIALSLGADSRPSAFQTTMVLLGFLVPSFEAMVRAGIPVIATMTARDPAYTPNNWREKILPELLSALCLIMMLQGAGWGWMTNQDAFRNLGLGLNPYLVCAPPLVGTIAMILWWTVMLREADKSR
ncbi:MAG TPA: hypothetical protein VIK99_01460 [Thermaerobacter sp.]